ncbi:MAG: XylR family transcriptional regulator [Kiritimatiellae bacterium]|jgi:LacI family transcriptional regulator|nr:XylR family transcriptional regulator [Kiritimatiellia bacterium]
MNFSKSRIPQVAVFTQLTLKGHFDSFRGIIQYVKLHGPWRLYHMEGRPGEQRLLDLKRWGCTGIITGACNIKDATLISQAGVPVVVLEPSPPMLENSHPLAKYTCTRFDSHACGQLAAEYFLNRQYKHFAFVGDPYNLYWSREREQAFRKIVEQAGGVYHAYKGPTRAEKTDWAVEQPRMQKWLKSLFKPTALFVAMDGRGRQVLDACMGAGITVPDDIAVLGVDNDDIICETTFPTMSSVQTNGQLTGYWIAEHLNRLMQGDRLKKRIYSSTPTHIITRCSTEATAIKDHQIARALEFIWKEAGHGAIHVPDVVRKFGSSRRFAEIHFKSVMGHTILEEIQRVRLERVCSLLSDTNLPIGEISQECGFERESYLAKLFRKCFGASMSHYRAEARNHTWSGLDIST